MPGVVDRMGVASGTAAGTIQPPPPPPHTPPGGVKDFQDSLRDRGILPPEPDAGGEAVEPPPRPAWEGEFDKAWEQHQGTRENMFEQSYADQASAERRAANMNARMGAGMGGGFGAGMGQAALAGAQQRMQAESDWNKRGVELRMAHLDRQLKSAEARNDREAAEKIVDKQNAAMLEMTEIEGRFGAGVETLKHLERGERNDAWKDDIPGKAAEMGMTEDEYKRHLVETGARTAEEVFGAFRSENPPNVPAGAKEDPYRPGVYYDPTTGQYYDTNDPNNFYRDPEYMNTPILSDPQGTVDQMRGK